MRGGRSALQSLSVYIMNSSLLAYGMIAVAFELFQVELFTEINLVLGWLLALIRVLDPVGWGGDGISAYKDRGKVRPLFSESRRD